ncbi:MAG: UDP-3-O-(3-hydroxymyristoyl)glucosamine N-acyltransferase [Pseudomonadota bacterium]
MSLDHPGFFKNAGPLSLEVLADVCDARIAGDHGGNLDIQIASIAPLSDARSSDLSFLDNVKYKHDLAKTQAAACLVSEDNREHVPLGVVPLVTAAPYHAFARGLHRLYPDAVKSPVLGPSATAMVADSAVIEDGAVIEPGACIGEEAQIGRGSRIAAGAVVGYRCTVGRDCYIGPNASIICALVGDRVILHGGVRIGQDGFGFAMGPGGHLKVPQIGRVIIQDDVEIGANSSVDRGALSDTVIGEGSKIDNLVQIGHNVVIGRHCVIVSQVGISGSATLGDFVVMGGQSGSVGHVTIGTGVQIAGASHVKDDVPPGTRVGGTPAKPLREWARELGALKRLAKEKPKSAD